MKFLVLGTSNSILNNGWVKGLRQAIPNAEIENASVGASPGTQFAADIHRNFGLYDIVFIDSIPNDESYELETPGFSSDQFTNSVMHEIFSTIASQTLLVVIGICNRQHLYEESSVYSAYKRIAYVCGAQFIDFRSLLISFGNEIARPFDDVYEEHAAHPQSYISRFVGYLLGREVIENPQLLSSTIQAKNYSGNFTTWRAADSNLESALIKRTNTFTSGSYLVLSQGEFVSLPNPGLCIGVGVNIYGTSCVMEFSAEQARVTTNLRFCFELRPAGFMKLFLPLPNGVVADRLTVLDARTTPCLVPRMTHLPPQTGRATLEISHACFWSGHIRDSSRATVDRFDPQRLTKAVLRRATGKAKY